MTGVRRALLILKLRRTMHAGMLQPATSLQLTAMQPVSHHVVLPRSLLLGSRVPSFAAGITSLSHAPVVVVSAAAAAGVRMVACSAQASGDPYSVGSKARLLGVVKKVTWSNGERAILSILVDDATHKQVQKVSRHSWAGNANSKGDLVAGHGSFTLHGRDKQFILQTAYPWVLWR